MAARLTSDFNFFTGATSIACSFPVLSAGSVNDTGIVFLPYNAGHLAITVFMKDARAATAERERIIAGIARYAYDHFIFIYGTQ